MPGPVYLADVIKDPDEVLDYTIDWSDWLDSDTISSRTVTADAGLTKDSDNADTTTVQVWLSAVTELDVWYDVKVEVVTAGGRTAVRRFRVKGQYR